MNISSTSANVLITGRTDYKVSQIVVDDEQGAYIENEISWPEGMSCCPWIKRSEYVQRYLSYNATGTMTAIPYILSELNKKNSLKIWLI